MVGTGAATELVGTGFQDTVTVHQKGTVAPPLLARESNSDSSVD